MDFVSRRRFLQTGAAVTVLGCTLRLQAKPKNEDVDAVVEKGYQALKKMQADDGSIGAKIGGPGVSALAAGALLKAGKPADDPVVEKLLKYLESKVQKDGGIYEQRLANYTTCVAVMAFQEAKNDKYKVLVAKASQFLQGMQKVEEQPDATTYGGVGYDGKTRPDLSNTHFFIDALVASGLSKDDPAIKKSLVFISRCQNLKSEHNKLDFVDDKKLAEEDKGGFVYFPTEAEAAKSGGKGGRNVTPLGGLRSYGSMSYAGLKSLLYAGVSKDDQRVKAVLQWLRRNYSVSENPGQKDAGLFYYFNTFGKALEALGEEEFVDAAGMKHDWRQELFDELKKRQKDDGTWANENRAFFENAPELATTFAILSLSYCKKK